jgi:phage terminase small subunit
MVAGILIVKRRGRKVEVKVTKKMRNGYSPPDFVQTVNLENYKDIALFLHDLDDLYGVNMEKAIKQYLMEKENGWPF